MALDAASTALEAPAGLLEVLLGFGASCSVVGLRERGDMEGRPRVGITLRGLEFVRGDTLNDAMPLRPRARAQGASTRAADLSWVTGSADARFGIPIVCGSFFFTEPELTQSSPATPLPSGHRRPADLPPTHPPLQVPYSPYSIKVLPRVAMHILEHATTRHTTGSHATPRPACRSAPLPLYEVIGLEF